MTMPVEYAFDIEINGLMMTFMTSPEVFSPRRADTGTLMMLERAAPYFVPGTRVVDMGCGYGLAGIFASKLCGAGNIVMCDICTEALRLSAVNALRNGLEPPPLIIESDCFKNIDGARFDLLLVNPPYHANFNVPKEIIEKGFNRLRIGGRLLMVTKRLDWYKNKITAVFGGVSITKSSGYYVFEAQRRDVSRADKTARK